MRYVYDFGPVDDFAGMLTTGEYVSRLEALLQAGDPHGSEVDPAARVADFMETAFAAAKMVGWEGDIRGGAGGDNGPYVMVAPLGRLSPDGCRDDRGGLEAGQQWDYLVCIPCASALAEGSAHGGRFRRLI